MEQDGRDKYLKCHQKIAKERVLSGLSKKCSFLVRVPSTPPTFLKRSLSLAGPPLAVRPSCAPGSQTSAHPVSPRHHASCAETRGIRRPARLGAFRFPARAHLRPPWLERAFCRGTLPPAFRASDKPIAIACLRFVITFPEPPDFNLPLFISWSALPTMIDAFSP